MSRRGAWVESFYRVVVRTYPRAFRDRFGAEMVEGFSSTRADAGRLSMWRLALADAVVAVPREHLRAYRLRHGARAVDLARVWIFGRVGAAAGGPSGGGAGWRPRLGIAVLAADTRVALRSLLRSPAFTLVVVLSLALGVGANTALFTIVSAVWLAEVPGLDNPDDVGGTRGQGVRLGDR